MSWTDLIIRGQTSLFLLIFIKLLFGRAPAVAKTTSIVAPLVKQIL
jgi:hypothetical protein